MTEQAAVPDLLRGCWKRAWIKDEGGPIDKSTKVVWVQLESKMADVRVAADLIELAPRGSLSECSIAELRRIGQSDSSSGFTTCTPVEFAEARRRAVAEWFTGEEGVAFQPVSAYPELGLLEWDDDGDVLTERAPSGAYVEEWHRVPGTREPLRHVVLDMQRDLYVAGEVAVLVRDRPRPVARMASLRDLMAEVAGSRKEIRLALIDLVDCEFSVAERNSDGDYVITLSTLPWRVTETLDVPGR